MSPERGEDRKAIEALHQRDMQAARAGDYHTLRSLMDEDAVLMPPGGRRQRGSEDLDAAFRAMRQAGSQIEVLEYVQDFEEVRVLGEFAFEWGSVSGSVRSRATGSVQRMAYHLMRILRRQADGSWRVYRSIWCECPGP